jgi:DnaJ-class molecular chaperone
MGAHSMSTAFVQCLLCGRTTDLGDGAMSDEAATRIAERKGWTVKPTVCKQCNALPRSEYRTKMRAWKKYSKANMTCPQCHGHGKVYVTPRNFGTCQRCHGEGVVPRSKETKGR